MELNRLSKAANLASNSYNEVVTKVEKQVPKGYSNGTLDLDIGPDGSPKEEDVYGFKLLNILSTPLTFVDDEQLLLSYRFMEYCCSCQFISIFIINFLTYTTNSKSTIYERKEIRLGDDDVVVEVVVVVD